MSYHREAQYMANMIEIVKADPAKKEDYKRIFENSPLYNHYFKNTDLLDKVLGEPFDPFVYTDYLEKKYGELYGI